jgi:flavin reductase (DIM6/NTAB) family NADH-FMN oxidoreductase RutF
MYYEPEKADHGLPHDPLKALVVPRPIAWISTTDQHGRINLAPYSFFNLVAGDPPCVMFASTSRASGAKKDSQLNAERSGEFVVNIVSGELIDAMMTTSIDFPAGHSEFEEASLATLPSVLVRPRRVACAPAHLECRYLKTVDLPSNDPKHVNAMILGTVIAVHIDDAIIVDGVVSIERLRPVGRLGYRDYTVVRDGFTKQTPAAPMLRTRGIG